MKLLNVSSGYAKQALYKQLNLELASLGVDQKVYVPVRSEAELGRNQPDGDEYSVEFDFILRKYHRLLFRKKIASVQASIIQKELLEGVELIHAHFLFSDGAVALQLKRELGIPFITAVRNTDINMFFKFRPDLKGLAYEILNEAEAVVCLNQAYKEKLLQKAPSNVCPQLDAKLHVIPNGIEQSWLANLHVKTDEPKVIRCIYVGELTKNKNIKSTIAALAELNKVFSVELTVVGAGGNGEKDFQRLRRDHSFIKYHGRITDRIKLREIMRQSDIFVMPSLKETFGLVYIEALSQGLPIIYSIGQGVDGYLDDLDVGRKVDPRSVKELQSAILDIFQNLSVYREHCSDAALRFDWAKIAKNYVRLYKASVPSIEK